MTRWIHFSSVLLAGLMLVGCGGDEAAQGEPTASSAAWRLADAPGDAVDVAAAKASVAEGDSIVVRGRIGGRMEPISPDSGVFVIMDPAVPSCADMPGDACQTPWDYCCETPQSITANAATVQLRDAEGNPVRLASGALTPLSEVIVTGTVAPRPNSDTLMIHATGVHVVPRP